MAPPGDRIQYLLLERTDFEARRGAPTNACAAPGVSQGGPGCEGPNEGHHDAITQCRHAYSGQKAARVPGGDPQCIGHWHRGH